MVVPPNSPTKKNEFILNGMFLVQFFHSTAKSFLDNVDNGENSTCLVVFPGWKLFGFTASHRQVDSVKNQYEHFLSLMQAHCSMVRDPRRSDVFEVVFNLWKKASDGLMDKRLQSGG